MARIRTIKPEFFRHEELFEAERRSGLPLRLAFAGLWTAADRSGRFRWQPRALKLDCLPYDEVDFSAVLSALSEAGFIVKYQCEDGGDLYGYIPGWSRHQIINNRETESVLPDPSTSNPRVPHACPTRLSNYTGEGKGREGEGKDKKDTEAHASAADAAPKAPVYTDSKHELWGEGVPILGQLGVTERSARSNIGRWLRDAKDDAQSVLGAIQRARDNRVMDPIPWITRALQSPNGTANVAENRSLVAAARRASEHFAGAHGVGEQSSEPVFRLVSQS